MSVPKHWTEHEFVGHPLILSGIGCPKFMTVLDEMDFTLNNSLEWHKETTLFTIGLNSASSIFVQIGILVLMGYLPHAILIAAGFARYGNSVIGPPGDWTWLRIVRRQQGSSELYSAYSSRDGLNWVGDAKWTHSLGSGARIGLVSQSGDGFIADFDYVRVSTLPWCWALPAAGLKV